MGNHNQCAHDSEEAERIEGEASGSTSVEQQQTCQGRTDDGSAIINAGVEGYRVEQGFFVHKVAQESLPRRVIYRGDGSGQCSDEQQAPYGWFSCSSEKGEDKGKEHGAALCHNQQLQTGKVVSEHPTDE